jgi:hypothetical protein
MTRRLAAVAWFLILAGAALTAAGGVLAWVGVAGWVTGLALQVVGISRAWRMRLPRHLV